MTVIVYLPHPLCPPFIQRRGGRILKRGALLLKLSNDVIVLGEGIAYAVFPAKPKRDAAAGAAVTYRVEIMPAFDDGVYQSALVAMP